MTKKCLICNIEASPGCSRSFHLFPKDETKRRKWIVALKLETLLNFNTTYVCSNHFDNSCYGDNDEQRRRKKLLSTAVPQISQSPIDIGHNDYNEESIGRIIDINNCLVEQSYNNVIGNSEIPSEIDNEPSNVCSKNLKDGDDKQQVPQSIVHPRLSEAGDTHDESTSSARSDDDLPSDIEKPSTSAPRTFSKNDAQKVSEKVSEEKSRKYSGKFSWQKKLDVMSCEPEDEDLSTTDYSQDADDDVETADNDAESGSNYVCNKCNKPVIGERFTCVQCPDYDLCTSCASEGDAHREHYMLRVPPRRPPDEVERVLQTLRSMLNSIGTINPSADKNQEIIDGIKTEIIDEFEEYGDPLDMEVEQPTEHNVTHKRAVPANIDTELQSTQHMHKRMKEDKDDAKTGAAIQKTTTDVMSTSVPSKIRHQQNKTPLVIIPTTPIVLSKVNQTQAPVLVAQKSIPEPVKTQGPAVVGDTNLNRQILIKPVSLTRDPRNPTSLLQKKFIVMPIKKPNLLKVDKECQTVPVVIYGTKVENPIHRQKQKEKLSTDITGKSTVRSKPGQTLVIENMQIRVARDEPSSKTTLSKDAHQIDARTCPSTSGR